MPDVIASAFKQRAMGGSGLALIDLDTDDIKVMLATATYTPAATHDFRDDITNEVTGTGYTTGGVSLASKTVTATGANFMFDSADPSWATATITARYAILYKNVGTAATDPVIGVWDFGANVTSTAGTFTIQVAAGGWLQFQ